MSIAEPVESVEARQFSLRERRRLGLTVWKLASLARQRQNRDEWSEDKRSNAAALAADLCDENPQAWFEAGERDWASFLEAIIAFIEKLMPLIQIFMGFI